MVQTFLSGNINNFLKIQQAISGFFSEIYFTEFI